MEKAFEQLMEMFVSKQCYEELFLKFNFTHVDCLKMALSKVLSYGIIAGSLLLKVPQILKILAAKSGEGISVVSELLMVVALFGSMSYGYFRSFPYSSYGDTYFLFIQSVIILLLVLFYQKRLFSVLLCTVAIGSSVYMLYTNAIPENVILALNGFNVLLTCGSKLIQAYVNYSNSSTGALSAITLILQFLGGVARIFTSLQETGDVNLIASYAISSVANGLLVFQLIYYWNSNIKQQRKIKKNK